MWRDSRQPGRLITIINIVALLMVPLP